MKGHARNLMTDHVFSVTPEMPLPEIARALVAVEHGGAPVVDQDMRVIGFVSEVDVINAMLGSNGEAKTARDIMSHPVIVADEFMPTDEVLSLLRQGRVHHLPVVRLGKLVGIITLRDVLEHVVERILPPPKQNA